MTPHPDDTMMRYLPKPCPRDPAAKIMKEFKAPPEETDRIQKVLDACASASSATQPAGESAAGQQFAEFAP